MTREVAMLARFLLAGAFNTAIGYGFILAGLFLGAGDYLANIIGFALGLPIAYALHRSFTFRVERRASPAEAVRYALTVLIAFAANLGVVAAGRSMGYVEHPLVQLAAVCVYAAVFYVISRMLVFPAAETASDPGS